MTEKIFRSVMAVAVGVMLASVLIIIGCLYDYFGKVQTKQLWEELSFAVAGVESAGDDYFNSISDSNNRLTWIAADGSVIYDAQADEKTMENHAEREEVSDALTIGEGESERYSDTLLEKTIYCAKRLSDGSVLRISVSRATMGKLTLGMIQPICAVLLVSFILALFLASRLSKRIVEPLNRLDLDHPLDNKTYDEITPLLRRISKQRKQIDKQMQQLKQKRDEFDQITASMNEGLVLLNAKGVILSINPSAEKLFNTEQQAVGRDFLTVERSCEINDAISTALNSGHSEICIERNGHEYQIDVSRIESDAKTAGLVLLAFDVTEKSYAERTRREFTANVSHELKTPLTTILGSSEMIANGMVKAEDLPRFVGHIHSEAARLLTLIEDIIRLSQLDEGVELPQETVRLDEIVNESIRQLTEKAQEHKVCLNANLHGFVFTGISRLTQEIVYNLVENAIKYNNEGGVVNISVTDDGVLTVADNGVGIPPEHIDRVFERFYRVDKSHSKQIGGTGLGLSIVKHAVAYLGAEINLQSEVGRGTTVTVRFPK